ncbi:hypothetical protein [Sorangium sp. So ce693]|uniref:hypothetical protein n=1 Tax=Sorangium sp. So ce693 TaxID=3133318 RepID=UPI003F6343DC
MDGESPFLLKHTSGGTLWVAGTFYGSIDVGSGPVAPPSTTGFVFRIPARK